MLDDSDVMGEQPYTLEVTSRGVDRPLTLPRHWRRNADRLVKVTLTDGDVGDRPDRRLRRRRRADPRRRRRPAREVAYAEVAQGLVQIEFNRDARRRRRRRRREEDLMDIDMSILRMLEREKEISFDVLVEAIEQALLTAYHKTPGAHRARAGRARPQDRPRHRDRRRARRRRATKVGEFEDTPDGLRPDRRDDREADHAAAAARRRGRDQVRRVLRQGGRHHLRRHPAGSQPRRRDGRPRQARGAAAGRRAGAGGELRARHPDQVPGGVGAQGHARARRSRCRARTPTWSRSCSRSRCPRSPTAPSRSPRSPARPATAPRSRSGPTVPGVNAKGACIGPMGQRVRNVMSRAARREDRHRRLVRGPGRAGRQRAVAGPGH